MWSWLAFLPLVVIIQLALTGSPVKATDAISITSPKPGEAIQGIISITGTSALAGFVTSEVDFTYEQKEPAGWFLIQENDQAVADGALATWDTTTITDGNYNLQLIVKLQDGSEQTVQVDGIRVRNYSLIETAVPTPVPTHEEATNLLVTVTPSTYPEVTETYPPLQTPLPPNSASLNNRDILSSLGIGGAVVAGLFLAAWLFMSIKSYLKH